MGETARRAGEGAGFPAFPYPNNMGIFFLLPISWMAAMVRRVNWSVGFLGFHTASYAALGATAILIAAVSALLRGRVSGKGSPAVLVADLSTVVALVAATVLVFAPEIERTPAVMAWACASGGAGTAWSTVRWGAALSRLQTRDLVSASTGGMIVNALLVAFLSTLPPSASFALLCLAPFASCVLLRLFESAPLAELPELYPAGSAGGFARLGLGVVVYSAILDLRTHLGYGTFITVSGIESAAVQVIIGAGVLLLILQSRQSGSVELTQAFRALMVLFAICFTAIPVAGPTAGALLSSCVTGLVSATLACLTMVAAYIAGRSPYGPYVVFGVMYALYGLPRLAVSGIVAALDDVAYIDGGIGSLMQAGVLLLVAVAASFSLMEAGPGMAPLLGDFTSPASPKQAPGRGAPDYSKMKETFMLTDREIEVMALICQGRSKSYIAESLFISENTVKAPWKRLYEKLGVHSKQALIDLVEEIG